MRKILFLWISSLFICQISAAANVSVASTGSDLDGISCKLSFRSSNEVLNYSCSGIFISEQLFLTAAHCLRHESLGYFVKALQQKYQLETSIDCAHQSFTMDSAFIPKSQEKDVYVSYEGGLNLQIDAFNKNQYRGDDFAILKTKEKNIFPFPDFVRSEDQANLLLKQNDCSFIGFGPALCDTNSGAGCLRKQSVFEETFVENFYSKDLFFSVNSHVVGGDSGSGLVCKNPKGERYLMGVITGIYYSSYMPASLNGSVILNVKDWLTNQISNQNKTSLNLMDETYFSKSLISFLENRFAFLNQLPANILHWGIWESQSASAFIPLLKNLNLIFTQRKYRRLILSNKIETIQISDSDQTQYKASDKILIVSFESTAEEIEKKLIPIL